MWVHADFSAGDPVKSLFNFHAESRVIQSWNMTMGRLLSILRASATQRATFRSLLVVKVQKHDTQISHWALPSEVFSPGEYLD